MKQFSFCFAMLFITSLSFSQTSIIPFGSSYKYLDNGTNQGTAWRPASFSDASWKTGNAQLGYGDGDEVTIVNYGPNAKKKYITSYFRKTVAITTPSGYTNFTLGLKRDDGAVVYVNNAEVFRSNMPTGTISYTTKASTAASDDGNTVQTITLPVTAFINGNNTVAVEVHQFASNDPDLSFDLQLIANSGPANVPPIANAGADQSITLPANSVSLSGDASSDPDGNITSYAWSIFSGPASGTITPASGVGTMATGLAQGTYIIRLTVTDNGGATAFDDMTVIVNPAPVSAALTRGPYLQMANGSAVTLRWRSDVATDSKMGVGTSFGTYTLQATNNTTVLEHEVRITGLTPDTKYFYSFGSSTQTLQAGTNNFFTTAPDASTTRKIRIAAYGDCGRNDNGFQSGTLTAYQNYVGSSPAEIMLLLGDNAYDAGTDLEYTSNFFNAYSSNILKNHVVFPSPGNHDYANTSARQTDHNVPYYSIFTMPKAAECGGVASGTEAYYSYNWGNIHFLSLDSYGFETGSTRLYDTLGPQAVWVKNDLAANTSKWTIAYWHHPPYTMGSHNSDTETELVNMRQKFIGIMERYGVDMIICGHSHDYERSFLLKGYVGNEASFNVATNALSGSNGQYDGSYNSCPYNVASGIINHGTVYVVAGSAGADGGVQAGWPHNALPFSVDDGGMLYFEVENNRLDAKFLRRDGTVGDKFTILKDAGKTTNYNIISGQAVTLTASWTGNYIWSTGATTQSITVSPATSANYSCSDGSSCITDNFIVNVLQAANSIYLVNAKQKNAGITIYPTPVRRGESFDIIGGDNAVLATLLNDKGQKLMQFKIQGVTIVNTERMAAGLYFLRTEIDGKKIVKKILITE